MTLQKAEIIIKDGGVRGLGQKDKSDKKIKVQFNPTEYSLSKDAQIAQIGVPGIDSPILQFVAGQSAKLTMDLFFDTTSEGIGQSATDVRQETERVYQLVKIQPDTHAPPRVQFLWGGVSFDAIVTSVQQKFTLFSPNGVPLRATLSVTFQEYKSLEQQLKELNLQSADHTKVHKVVQGDTLAAIAASEYGNSALWRVIAEKNQDQLTNLRRLTPGTELRLPPLDDGQPNVPGGVI
ncbi:MAG: peptidoglycan-binding protein [Gemmataceae bacterium]